MKQRRFIHITGIVQGVGFRPFVYQLAIRHQLAGSVINDSEGVKVDVQGDVDQLDEFISELTLQAPPLSRIDQVAVWPRPLHHATSFAIEQSKGRSLTSVCLSPDQGICEDCRADIADPTSRYYRYPFTNCTHCGPRYTIVEALPYDRAVTGMRTFSLCQPCQQAYQNPLDRRYHAQPISCDHCGPRVRYVSGSGEVLAHKASAIAMAARTLRQGGIIAIKGLGGFHLACDASNSDAVARLRQIKRRQRKPFAVMVANGDAAKQLVSGEAEEWDILQSQASPIVLMQKKVQMEKEAEPQSSLAANIAPGVPYLGVMLPYTPLHVLLFEHLDRAIVLTSANGSGMPMATEFAEVSDQLGDLVDGVLDHNRPIVQPCDDSVVHFAGGKCRVMRMARGYAPYSQPDNGSVRPILAMGAQQKAAIGLSLAQQWILSPYVGDIDDIDTQHRYLAVIRHFESLYQVEPEQIVCDRHPGYVSTQYAIERQQQASPAMSLHQVQHHHAHILAVMAEHKIKQTVLGFAFDGTGWGDDGTVWGGEVLLSSPRHFKRVFHLRPFRLLGGERAIKSPARIVFAMLLECYTLSEIKAMGLAVFKAWSESKMDNLFKLWQSGNSSPYTSSMGRLIDAWASLLGLVDSVDYEGECGLLLERAALAATGSVAMEFQLAETNMIDWQPLLDNALSLLAAAPSGLSSGTQPDTWSLLVSFLSRGLLEAIAHNIKTVAVSFPTYPVVLSGGVFQNRVLLDLVYQQLSELTNSIYCGETIPVNDGGIAAGQLWYATHQPEKGLSGSSALHI